MVESPPADAGDMGSCPGPGRSHVPRSGWAHEPWLQGLCVRSLCSTAGEAATVGGPRTAKTKQNKTKKELRVMIIKMIQDLGKRMETQTEKIQEMLKSELEDLKNKQR